MDNVKFEDLEDSSTEFIEKDETTPESLTEPVLEEQEEKVSTSSAASTGEENKPAVDATPTTTITTMTTNIEATKDVTDNFDDEPDETLLERLLGLTEMFPDCVQNFAGSFVSHTSSAIRILFRSSCNATWMFFSSSIILFVPVVFEAERALMQEMQRAQHKQALLGPSSAIATTGPPYITPKRN